MYKVKATSGGNLQLLFPTMSKWGSDDDYVIGEFLGTGEMKTKIGMADLLNLKILELGIEQQNNDKYPPVKVGDDASLMVNGSFKNNFNKLVERHGEVMTLPDGSPKVENGEIVRTILKGTLLRISRQGTYDSPMRADCVNISIDILERESSANEGSLDNTGGI